MSLVFIVCGSLMGLLQLGPVAWLIEKKGEYVLLPFGFLFLSIGIFMLTTSTEMTWILIYVAFISMGMAMLTPSLASYWIVAAILLVVTYLVLPKKKLLIDNSSNTVK